MSEEEKRILKDFRRVAKACIKEDKKLLEELAKR